MSQIVVLLFTAQVAFASGQGDKELKTSCLLQHQVLRDQPLQLSDEAADVGSHAEYLRSALVMVKELASNVTNWDTGLSQSEVDALKLIKVFIDDLKKSANISHGEDQREVNRAKGLIENCATVTNDALIGDVNQAKTRMQGSRQDHNACRTSEADCQEKENDRCGKWDSYRQTNSPIACAGVDFKNDMKSDLPATKVAMEKCLRELQPFYSQHLECWKYGECVKEIAPFCDDNQTKFEADFCSYSRQLSGTCDDQKVCRQQHISFRNATHRDVAANEAARKADYITSQKVLCYFQVFESSNTNKKAILRGCEQLAVSASHLNISYPAIPAAWVCVVEPSEPCDNDWVSTEYDAKPWKKHVTMLDCKSCQTGPTPPPPQVNGTAKRSYYSMLLDHCEGYSSYKRWCVSCGGNSQGIAGPSEDLSSCQTKCDEETCLAVGFKPGHCITYYGACQPSGDGINWGFQYYTTEAPGVVT